MRKGAFTLALVVTIGSLIVSAMLWQQLHAERTRAAQLLQRDAARVALEAKPAPVPAIPIVDQPHIAPSNASSQSSSAVEGSQRAAHRTSVTTRTSSKPPREASEFNYPDIAEELSLRSDETDALYLLLAQGADEDALIQLLGPYRYRLLRDYQRTVSARHALRARQPYFAQTPLTKEQYKLYVEVLTEEEERFKEEARRNSNFAASDPTFDLGSANMQAKEESVRREFELARGFLTPAQVNAIEELTRASKIEAPR